MPANYKQNITGNTIYETQYGLIRLSCSYIFPNRKDMEDPVDKRQNLKNLVFQSGVQFLIRCIFDHAKRSLISKRGSAYHA